MRNSRARALDIFGEGEDSGHRMENTIEWGGSKTGLARRTTEGSGQIEVLEQRAVGSEKIPHQTGGRSEEQTSELQSLVNLVCRLLL